MSRVFLALFVGFIIGALTFGFFMKEAVPMAKTSEAPKVAQLNDVVYLDKYQYTDVAFVSNYDGDTMRFVVRKSLDAGFGVIVTGAIPIEVRLLGGDTFEMKDKNAENKAKAVAARDLVQKLLSEAVAIKLVTHKDEKEKYGRYLAEVYFTSKDGAKGSIIQVLNENKLTTGRFSE